MKIRPAKSLVIFSLVALMYSILPGAHAQDPNQDAINSIRELLANPFLRQMVETEKVSGWIENRIFEDTGGPGQSGGKSESFMRLEIVSMDGVKAKIGNEHTFYRGRGIIQGFYKGMNYSCPEWDEEHWNYECPMISVDCEGRLDEGDSELYISYTGVPKEYEGIVGSGIGAKVKQVGTRVFTINEKRSSSEDGFFEQRTIGEFCMFVTKKMTLGEDLAIDEPLETDKVTIVKVTVPDIGEVNVNTNSKVKFDSDSEMEMMLGEIYSKIKKLPPDVFKVRTPQAALAVRGTQFITKVEKGGTTTLTVFDGKVEFSDINKKKTVIAKENQKSVVKPGGLPSEPVFIDSGQIPAWWE